MGLTEVKPASSPMRSETCTGFLIPGLVAFAKTNSVWNVLCT
jgi:hypothetical protein